MIRILLANKLQWVKQHDSMQCGVSCLAMICRHHGRNYSIEYLDRYCHANALGVSMLGITECAKVIGINVMTVEASIVELNNNLLPCILHWNQNHFVVLYKIKNGKKFFIADPAKGLVTYTLDEFKEHWISTHSDGEDKGVAMFLEPTPAFYENKDGDDDSNKEKRSFRFLFGYIRKYKKYFGQTKSNHYHSYRNEIRGSR